VTDWGADNPPSIPKYSGKNREAELTRSDSERLWGLSRPCRGCPASFASYRSDGSSLTTVGMRKYTLATRGTSSAVTRSVRSKRELNTMSASTWIARDVELTGGPSGSSVIKRTGGICSPTHSFHFLVHEAWSQHVGTFEKPMLGEV
jgi:hypothetical protein